MESFNYRKKFRCYVSEGRIIAHGIITDATNFFMLDELTEESQILDFAHVSHASWIGLVNLCKYLNNKSRQYTLSQVPYRIFRHLRLLTHYNKGIQVSSLMVELYATDSYNEMASERTYRTDEIVSLASQGPCVNDASRRFFIPEPIEYLNFEACKKVTPIAFHESLKWSKSEFDELIFWYQIQKFTAETIDLMTDMHRTQNFQIFESLEKIRRTVVSFEQVFDPVACPKTKAFKSLENWFNTEMHAVANVLEKIFDRSDYSSRVIFFHLFFDRKKITNSIYVKILSSCSEIVDVVKICSAVEGLGSVGTERFIEMDLCKSFHKIFEDVVQSGKLHLYEEQIREKFNILDLTSKAKDFNLKEYLIKAIDSIDEVMMSEMISSFQGFDLLNQVINHRLAEAEFVIDHMDKLQQNEISSQEFQTLMLKKIKSGLVTDQEQATFEFYFSKSRGSF